MKRALERHRKQTEKQAERLEECLAEHDATPAKTKEAGGVMAALMESVVDMARGDKAGRNARDGFATEHMEIASYQMLERVAKKAGDKLRKRWRGASTPSRTRLSTSRSGRRAAEHP